MLIWHACAPDADPGIWDTFRFMSSSPRPIDVWTPGIRDDSGGIQAFSRFFVRALAEGLPQHPLRVFVRNETLDADDPLRSANLLLRSYEKLPSQVRSHALAADASLHSLRQHPACQLSTHLHFLPAMRLMRAVTGAPYAGVLHGIEAWRIRSRSRIGALRTADRLLAVSHFTRDQVIREHGVPAERVSVFPNTFDDARFHPGPKPVHLLQKYGLRPDQPVLLTVSRLALSERYKGHWQVLMALQDIRRHLPDVHYLVVGTGDEMGHLREGVRAMGLEKNVTFAGFVSAVDLPDHYRLCDAFVMPSTKEGFGIVFLEAAACGKPVIGGCLDGSFDALDGGRLGILIDPHHPVEIAAAIQAALTRTHENRLLFDPHGLSKAVRERFGFESFKTQLLEEVTPLLNPSSGSVKGSNVSQTQQKVLSPGVDRAPRIVVMTQLNSPYQVEFFNHVARAGECHLEVIYLTHRDKNRQWVSPDIAHSHIILSETPQLKKNALDSLLSADLAVFNYYTDRFAWRAIRARAACGLPWVFWGERPGFLQLGPPGAWFRRLALKPLHQDGAPIWGVGQWGINGYQAEFGRQRPYHNMPYYSDLRRFHTTRAAPPAGARTFLYSGTLSERKGVDLLARAFARVAAETKQARLILLGSGPLEPLLREILAPCAAQVEWAGFQPWQELPRFYARGDIFCFPSRYDGWGLALVEALASGMPAITTDQTGAAIDLIRPGRNGWLTKAGDENALAQTMREALALPPDAFGMMQDTASQCVRLHDVLEGAKNFTRAARNVLTGWPGARQPPASSSPSRC